MEIFNLWLLQEYDYPTLKKDCYLIWSLPKFKLSKVLTDLFGETNQLVIGFYLISIANLSNVLIDFSNVIVPSFMF